MKKILSAIGGVTLALIAVAGGFIGYGIYLGTKLDASSKAYVDQVIPEIVSVWSAESLKREASAELSKRPDKASCFSSKLPKRYRPEDALG